MLKLKVSRWGNSLALRLPLKICELLEISDGDNLILTVKDGKMTLEKQALVCGVCGHKIPDPNKPCEECRKRNGEPNEST